MANREDPLNELHAFGRVTLREIWKDAPEGGVLLGHRLIRFDIDGNVVSERDVYSVRVFFDSEPTQGRGG